MTQAKQLVGTEVAERAQSGQVIGAGTGSTADAALKALGRRAAAERLDLAFVATSLATAWLCGELGLRVYDSGYQGPIHWGFDGADAVDHELRAVKGRGGAMLREKIMAARCEHYVLIVDESKLKERLGSDVPVPVEVRPDAVQLATAGLQELGAVSVELRSAVAKHGPVITEAGNVVIDAVFTSVSDRLEADIKSLVGVVESGLFLNYAAELLVGGAHGVRCLERGAP